MSIFSWLKYMFIILIKILFEKIEDLLGKFQNNEIVIKSEFNETQAALIHRKGDSVIRGQSYFIKNDGDRWTGCGMYYNKLIPATDYARERMIAKFGNETEGYVEMDSRKWRLLYKGDEDKYRQYMRETYVDNDGNFEFRDVCAGDYFILSFPRRSVTIGLSGGDLMKKVTVKNNETHIIDLIKDDRSK